jgi:curli production assembly/transport component CsgG
MVFVCLLSACSFENAYNNRFVNEAKVTDTTTAGQILETLPLPKQPLAVAVYDFQDQTGRLRENPAFAEYSSAVTKGGLSVLIKALLDSGNGKWFMVAERGNLNDLLKERQIIRAMRADYLTPDGKKLGNLPPLIYGGLLLEGGIIFYDSNVLTGGAAAGYFGISSLAQYSRDMVSVYLRVVDISTGRVMLSVTSSKTIFSYSLQAGISRYISYDKLLEAETGYTVNEPSQLAVREAIETAVYSLIMEGAARKMWDFTDPDAGRQALYEYWLRKTGQHDANGWRLASMPAATTPEHIVSSGHAPANPAPVTNNGDSNSSGFFSWLR